MLVSRRRRLRVRALVWVCMLVCAWVWVNLLSDRRRGEYVCVHAHVVLGV